MTLALSVLSSSVGMCGASAAEALPDTDDSGLQVTVVPLADSNADTDTSSDDKPTIERPEQSETVETLPGTAEDNKDHIKGEDKETPKIRARPARRPPAPAILTPATRRKRARKVPALRRPRRKSPKRPPKRMTPITAVPMTRRAVISRSPSTSKRTLRVTRPLS